MEDIFTQKARDDLVHQLIMECSREGLRSVELQMEWIKSHPSNPLPNKLFNHAETVHIFEMAVEAYKQRLKTEKA